MKINKKLFTPFLLIIALLIVGGVVVYSRAQFLTYKDDAYGLEFRYPKEIIFEKDEIGMKGYKAQGADIYMILGHVCNGKTCDNYGVIVTDLVFGKKIVENPVYAELSSIEHKFLPSELNLNGNKFAITDQVFDSGQYNVDAYYLGAEHLFHFNMSINPYSKEKVESFKQILSSAKLK